MKSRVKKSATMRKSRAKKSAAVRKLRGKKIVVARKSRAKKIVVARKSRAKKSTAVRKSRAKKSAAMRKSRAKKSAVARKSRAKKSVVARKSRAKKSKSRAKKNVVVRKLKNIIDGVDDIEEEIPEEILQEIEEVREEMQEIQDSDDDDDDIERTGDVEFLGEINNYVVTNVFRRGFNIYPIYTLSNFFCHTITPHGTTQKFMFYIFPSRNYETINIAMIKITRGFMDSFYTRTEYRATINVPSSWNLNEMKPELDRCIRDIRRQFGNY